METKLFSIMSKDGYNAPVEIDVVEAYNCFHAINIYVKSIGEITRFPITAIKYSSTVDKSLYIDSYLHLKDVNNWRTDIYAVELE